MIKVKARHPQVHSSLLPVDTYDFNPVVPNQLKSDLVRLNPQLVKRRRLTT